MVLEGRLARDRKQVVESGGAEIPGETDLDLMRVSLRADEATPTFWVLW